MCCNKIHKYSLMSEELGKAPQFYDINQPEVNVISNILFGSGPVTGLANSRVFGLWGRNEALTPSQEI